MVGIGTLEFAVAALVTLSVLVMNVCGYLSLRWGFAIFGCTVVGALITPTDVFSMLVMTVVLLGVYYAGSKHKTVDMPGVTH